MNEKQRYGYHYGEVSSPVVRRPLVRVAAILIALAVLWMLALASPAIGQNTPACLGCGSRPVFPLHGWIDAPHWSAVNTYYVGYPISGWQLDGRAGQQPPFVAISVREFGPHQPRWVVNYTVERSLSRPDVREAYLPSYPAIGTNDAFGYTVRINEILSPGLYVITVFWSSGDELTRSENRFVRVN